MLRRYLPKVALSLGAVFAALLGLELGLRIIGYDPLGAWLRAKGDGRPVRISEKEHLRYELVPNAEFSLWRTPVKINSHGFRDSEYPIAKTGRYRMVVLGDSIAFGNGVAIEDAFSEVLERSLNRRLGDRVEVLNLGVGGYDIIQEVALLEHLGLPFSPDLVILAFCTNDIGDFTVNLQYLRNLEQLKSPLYGLRAAQFLKVFADRLGALAAILAGTTDAEFYESKRQYIAPVAYDSELMGMIGSVRRVSFTEHLFGLVSVPKGLAAWWSSEAHVGMLEYGLAWLARLRDAGRFETLVMMLPWLEDEEPWDVVYRIVAHEARKFGFPVLDLSDPMAKEDFATLRSAPQDRLHPNEKGHLVIARELEAHLLASGLAEKMD